MCHKHDNYMYCPLTLCTQDLLLFGISPELLYTKACFREEVEETPKLTLLTQTENFKFVLINE